MIEGKNGIRYYTPKELADSIGVSDRTVYYWINSGKLKAEKYRLRELLISEQEAAIFLHNNFGEV